ncbi:hypothetical protein C1645_841850 [Glomus cerebriforme]|uniref:Uncharacterized protein n=1 Tax=Glomus cerebriforme TaxID=658196 RepID=A0A397RXR9_9GLOM|nr:hypothetical protein C1645_841850 [Glomus cerebriforme]
MSGNCPEIVQNNNHTNSGHCHCPENVPKRDRFRHSVFVLNLFCFKLYIIDSIFARSAILLRR